MGGRPVELNADARRRTIYGFIDRQNLPSMFRAFDFASPDTHSPQRFVTTVPQQALFMMNSPFAVSQAKSLVKRPELASEKDDAVRIKKLYALLFSREATQEEIALGLGFIKSTDASVGSEKPKPSPWQYGYGEYDEKTGRVKSFKKLTHFNGTTWQVNATLPDTNLGWILLNAAGGHPGNDAAHAVIRRWTAPVDGVVSISGKLAHPEKKGNGVQARVISSRSGSAGNWTVKASEAEAKVDRLEVKAGDTIDFAVDPIADSSYDGFTWAPVIKLADPAQSAEWSATKDFGGEDKKMEVLTPWQKYAQVLLETNEFVFID
jgi:hypothetical protein